MHILLDRESAVPMYRQIEAYFQQSIVSGSLEPGTRLPAIRRLALDLGVNRITVETAYAELESHGLVIARSGSGTYVLPPSSPPITAESGDEIPWRLWQRELQAPDGKSGAIPPAAVAGRGRKTHCISFAGGTGDPRLFPVEPFRKTLQTVLRRDGVAALEYGDPRGYAPLRSTIARVSRNSSTGLITTRTRY